MTRIALLPSEVLRPRMAGIGIRYAEFARRLPRPGLEVVVVTAGEPADAGAVPGLPDDVRRFARGDLRRLLADCDAVIVQGQLANDVVREVRDRPVAVDLYDPWLIENLHYAPDLGLGPYLNDHAAWVLQLSRGDFFMCSSAAQRHFYLGFLTALGRVNPDRLAVDPTLDRLIAAVPFGVPQALPPHRPYLPPGRRASGACSSAPSTTGTIRGPCSGRSSGSTVRRGGSSSCARRMRRRPRSGCGRRWRRGAASAGSGKGGC